MTENPILIETSFADAIAIIAAASELPEQTRKHWPSSMRQIAKALDKPMEVIPARYSAVRADLLGLHHVPAGLTAKTMQNHKSNTKSALLWLAREKGVPEHGAPLTVEWEALRAAVKDGVARSRLSSFMRYCSANNISPAEADDAAVDRFVNYRARCGKPADKAFRRLLARAWNASVATIPGWPAQRFMEPAVKAAVEIAWEAFSEGLRRDVDRYLQGLTRIRKSRTGQRIRPLKESTIRTRRAELQAVARMAVKTGVAIAELDSLSALLAPDVAEKVLDAYWQKNGENPKLFTIDLACRFLAIAKETKCLNDKECERLDEMRRGLEDHRQEGLTDKNIAFLRQVLTPGVWERVLKLPFTMMAEARRQQAHGSVRAAVTAQLAVAIAVLSVAPIRLQNLTAIRLGTNLIKPGGPASDYWLAFPDYDVKNRVRLEFPLEQYLTRLIDEYVDFRPTLLRGRNEDYLFPGQREGAKGKTSFSGQIVGRIYKATGLNMTVHQFRHAAGAIILKQRPGEYELVRQLLGHRSVQTTISSYIGLDGIQASEIFTNIVMAHMGDDWEAVE
jgi:Phage integrase family